MPTNDQQPAITFNQFIADAVLYAQLHSAALQGAAASWVASGAMARADYAAFASALGQQHAHFASVAAMNAASASSASEAARWQRIAQNSSALADGLNSPDLVTRNASMQNVLNTMNNNLDAARRAGGEVLGPVGDLVALAQGLASGDPAVMSRAVVGMVMGVAAGAAVAAAVTALAAAGVVVSAPVAIAAAVLAALAATPAANWIADNVLTPALDDIRQWLQEQGVFDAIFDLIPDQVHDFFAAAQMFQPRRDPLVIDLDGDGIETIGANGSVLFDHDGDGVRTASGWVRPDDGLLVLDRNGNGRIDGGHELFGADTVLASGELARSGFEALAELDSNADGTFDVNDAAFGDVRVWRDLNQDGVSQANELFTLEQVGIASINLTPTSTANVNLGNGNVIDNSGTYTRTDGSMGLAGDMLFALNNFYRDFSGELDPVEVGEDALTLPALRGSGAVRDLREAATLSPELLSVVQSIGPGMSRDEMMDRVRLMLDLWSQTSTMETSEQQLETSLQQSIYYHGPIPAEVIAQGAIAIQLWREHEHARLAPMIALLERFNGSTLLGVGGDQVSTGGRTFAWQRLPDGRFVMFVEFAQQQMDLLVRSYEALQDAIYANMVMETRLYGYRDLVTLQVDDTGAIGWDYSALDTALASLRAQDPTRALQDVADIFRFGANFATTVGWPVGALLHSWISEDLLTEAGRFRIEAAGLNISASGTAQADVINGSDAADSLSGDAGDDMLFGRAGGDTLRGNDGNDILDGGEGNDNLIGGAGNDTLIGGVGNDRLEGNTGDDGYRIRLGDGHDTIEEYYGNDRIVFEGINPSDITSVERRGSDLVLMLGSGQSVTIRWYYSNAAYQVEGFEFADGTLWTATSIADRVVTPGTVENDTISGDDDVSRIFGYAGNDTLRGYGGDDLLDGGEGNDNLIGGTGNDTLIGGVGDDRLEGNTGDETYIIRAGDGNDMIEEYYGTDRVVFEGIDPSAVASVERRGTDLAIVLASGQTLTIRWYYSDAAYQVESFEFADGTVWNATSIADRVITPGTAGVDNLSGGDDISRIFGYAGNDTLRGYGGDDLLDGGEGEDNLIGGTGNDTLVGGVGNDRLEGNTGDETYIIRLGDGHDTIEEYYGNDRVVFEGIASTQVTGVERRGDDLVLLIGADQSVTIRWYFSDAAYQVESFQFSDSVSWSAATILGRVLTPGTAGADSISGGANADWMLGYAGNDTLRGYGGNDLLDGGEGNDNLIGGEGNDTLIGGVGNDRLEGNTGDETYVIRAGDGHDTIEEYYGTDRVVFEGIDASQVTSVERRGTDLVLVLGSGQSVTIRWYYSDAAYQVENFEFADGTVWNATAIADRVITPGTAANDSISGGDDISRIYGYAGNDTLRGYGGDDLLDGGEGNDNLIGGTGNDTLVGGVGADRLEGGTGDDTYLIRAGDGIDTIEEYYGADRVVFEGIDPSDVASVERRGTDLAIVLTSGQTLTIRWYYSDAAYQVENFEFADGTVWNATSIADRVVTPGTGLDDSISGGEDVSRIYGYAGNDTLRGNGGDDLLDGGEGNDNLIGGTGNDTLVGGLGNDRLEGGTGNDTYVIRAGDGIDTIEEYYGADRVVFEGIDPSAVASVERRGTDLAIVLTSGQTLTIRWYYSDAAYQVENFEFADGTVWNAASIAGRVITPGTAGADSISGGDDISRIYGYAGNDTLRGNGGDDLLDGGAGNDNLIGGIDNDTLIGGIGNDRLEGGTGDDTYVIRLGDGIDSIEEYYGNDRVVFDGIDPSHILGVARSGSDLLLTLVDGQSLTVRWFFSHEAYQVESFEFADGTSWDAAEITAIADGLSQAMAAFGPDYHGSNSDVLPPVSQPPVVLAPAA